MSTSFTGREAEAQRQRQNTEAVVAVYLAGRKKRRLRAEKMRSIFPMVGEKWNERWRAVWKSENHQRRSDIPMTWRRKRKDVDQMKVGISGWKNVPSLPLK